MHSMPAVACNGVLDPAHVPMLKDIARAPLNVVVSIYAVYPRDLECGERPLPLVRVRTRFICLSLCVAEGEYFA